MFTNTYKIADHIVGITSIYSEVQTMCSDYRCTGEAELIIETNTQDIEYERERSAREDAKEGIPTRVFPESYLETLAVYRKLCEKLIKDDILLFHGSVIAVDGEAYLFTAKSGIGKSTHTRLWREYFGERAFMVNDDKPLIRIKDCKAVVYGTPWDGKHHLSRNVSVSLKAICILERSEHNHIERITFKEAYPMIMQQAYRPTERSNMMRLFGLLDRLGEAVKLYRLGCNISREAVETSYNAMKGTQL